MDKRARPDIPPGTTHTASGVRGTEPLISDLASPAGEAPVHGRHGDYDVGAEIARGGMGRILEAYDRRHDRHVALKLLLRADGASAKRFEREAWITGRLQHPAIVPLYEAGRWPTGERFFAMKLVRGESLAEVIRAKTTHAERLALVPHLIAVTEALAYAHGEGILHRDLKPSNVLVGAFGETVVIDWGLAKVITDTEEETVSADLSDEAMSAATLTAEGNVLGTPNYMPPEQARGESIDARADVYALGACMYHALSGVLPYSARTAREAIGLLLAGAPPALTEIAPELPADLATIVAKAMARDKSDRYATAKEMADDLRRFAAGRLVSAHAYSLAQLVRRWVWKHRAVVALASVFVVAGAVFGVVGGKADCEGEGPGGGGAGGGGGAEEDGSGAA